MIAGTNQILTVAEVAAELRCSRAHVYKDRKDEWVHLYKHNLPQVRGAKPKQID